MEMQQIRYFLTLARTLNFTRAAEECDVSQSAMTRAIQALESELGGALIRREHRESHLTELGKRMLPLLERCFDSAVTAQALARSMAHDEVAPLALAISHSVNVELAMGPMAEVFRALPGLQLKLRHGDGGEVLDLLKQGEVELAIAGPLGGEWERLDRWPLFDEPFEAAVRDDHPLARDNEVTLEKLKAYPLFCQGGCEMHGVAVRIMEAHGVSNVHDVTTLHDLMAVIANDLGVALLPRSAPRGDTTRRMPVADLPISRTVSAYAVAGRRRGTAASAFLNLLRCAAFEPA
jgi:DNA-binding transcriptional LysR family regulator